MSNPFLERVRRDAQRTANRDSKPVAIYNLNRVGQPLYVIRNAPAGEAPLSFVETFQPQAECAGRYRMAGEE